MSEASFERSPSYDRSIAQLARDAIADLGSIVSKEVRLGRAEVSEKVDRISSGLAGIAFGAALLIPGLTLILFAAANVLATIDGLTLWAAMLIVGVVATLLGYVMLSTGKRNVDPSKLAPKKTIRNVAKDAAAVKEAL
jgi:drug/metabolite transporter (DMT)-like permease